MAGFKVGSNGSVSATATATAPATAPAAAAASTGTLAVQNPALPASLAQNPRLAAFWAAASKAPVIDTTSRKQGRYLGWFEKDDFELQSAIKGIQKGSPYLYVEGEYHGLAAGFSFMMLDPVEHFIRVTASFAFEYAAVAPTGENAFQAKLNADSNVDAKRKKAFFHRYINAKLIVFTTDGNLVPVTVTAQSTKLDAFRELAAEQARTTAPEWSKGDSVKAAIVGNLPVAFRVLGGMTMMSNVGENVSYIAKPSNIRPISEAESKLLGAWMEAGAPGLEETEEAYNYRLAAIEKVLLK
jgi:hypothetical protein